MQLRLDQNSSDPIFATRQMALNLTCAANRWVGKLAEQAWHVVMVGGPLHGGGLARQCGETFNERLLTNIPLITSSRDASLVTFERFF